MRKTTILLLTGVLTAALLTGCRPEADGGSPIASGDPTAASQGTASTTPTEPVKPLSVEEQRREKTGY